jgi:hypothetical protein
LERAALHPHCRLDEALDILPMHRRSLRAEAANDLGCISRGASASYLVPQGTEELDLRSRIATVFPRGARRRGEPVPSLPRAERGGRYAEQIRNFGNRK